MCRMKATVAVIPVVLTLAAACSRRGENAGMTTIRSGTPEGVRVTNLTNADLDAADRLAGAICRHERECSRTLGRLSTDEALALEENACMTEMRPAARINLDALECGPAVARAGIEECLASIRTERCETRLSTRRWSPHANATSCAVKANARRSIVVPSAVRSLRRSPSTMLPSERQPSPARSSNSRWTKAP